MYSVMTRASSVLGFFMTCLAIALPAISLLNFVIRPSKEPYVSVTVDRVSTRLGVEDYFMNRKVMLTDLSLDLEADFSSLFHWNVKQLFVYITLEYTTPKYKRNEIVFWDKILTSSNSPRLSITGLRNKYAVVDIDDQLPGSNAQIKLHWNTMPFVGFLGDTRKGHIDVRIPDIGEKQ